MDALAFINAETIEKQQKRIEALEQLCRDLYDCYIVGQYKECYECEYYSKGATHCDFTNRMEQLGILEGVDNG